MPSLFEPAGTDRFVATEHARGPWDPRHCHGGPVAALLARAVERTEPGEVDWQVARLTVELTRPVPVGRPLTLESVLERPGRRVSLVGAVLADDGVEVARVRGLRIRREELELPMEGDAPEESFPADPSASRGERLVFDEREVVSFARDACEHRFAEGSWTVPGPVADWIRLTVPVVPDEAPSGVQRAAAAADFGNGVSAELPWDGYLFINPDLTIHLARPPVGEWIGLLARTHGGSDGAGFAESALHDERGRVGRSVQSLYFDRR